jgi:lysophospholipase L1-like esterase
MYPWMESPYFALPPTGLALIEGQEVTIYGDALINVPIQNNLKVTYTSDLGTQSGNNFVIKPAAENIGDHTLSMTFHNNGRLITTQTIKMTVFAKSTAKTIKILLIGNSLIEGGCTYFSTQIVRMLSNSTITFLGTNGTITKNEGHGGATWTRYVNNNQPVDKPSPFFKAGVLNVPAYFADNSIGRPDYILISLGLNDLIEFSRVGGDAVKDEEIAVIIIKAKTLIDAFLAYDPNLKIILQIPSLTGTTGEAWEIDWGGVLDQDLFIANVHKYWVSFIHEFANGAYKSRVDCNYAPIFLNRTTGYSETANSWVHPNQSGYEQLGVGMALTFNKLLNSD